VDARAIYLALFLGDWSNLHGFFHTFIGATLLGLFTIIAVWVLREQLYTISKALRVEQDYSMYSIVAGSLMGVWLHIVLDSYMHRDMKPFWPFLEANPLYGGLFASFELLYVCLFGFFVGIVYYTVILMRSRGYAQYKGGSGTRSGEGFTIRFILVYCFLRAYPDLGI
jgi:membrane-bound metal-dependent hydrolase YbcI (DUF457 family)